MSQTSQEDFNPCSTSGLSALHKTFVWTAIFFFSLLFINKGDFLVAVISAWKGKLYVKIKVSKIFHPEPQNIIPYLSKKIVPEFCDNQDLGMPSLLCLFCVDEFFPNHSEIKQNCHTIVNWHSQPKDSNKLRSLGTFFDYKFFSQHRKFGSKASRHIQLEYLIL